MTDLLDADQTRALERQHRWGTLADPLQGPLARAMMRLVFRYDFVNVADVRRVISARLTGHRGPIICVSNHLTHLDPYFVSWILLPIRRSFRPSTADRFSPLPWAIADESMYRERKGLSGFILRWWTYCARVLYVRRVGDELEAARSRETLFGRALWALLHGGWIGFFPEAKRSRSGWLDASEPKPLAGRLAQSAAGSAFLCFYIRGEHQKSWCHFPEAGETFRAYADWIGPDELEGRAPEEISKLVFERLGGLQEEWFKRGSLPKNCSGCEVVDLKDGDRESAKRDAARGAAAAALRSAGLPSASIDVDLFKEIAVEKSTATEVRFRFVVEDAEKVLCLAVLRGGRLGDASSPSDALWRVESVPVGSDPAAFARDLLLKFIAESSDDIGADELEFSFADGVPKVSRRGVAQDWGPSISSSGRFAACSFMTS